MSSRCGVRSPGHPASNPISVRRPAGSFHASSRPSVALGPLRFPFLVHGLLGEDSHLLISAHARHTPRTDAAHPAARSRRSHARWAGRPFASVTWPPKGGSNTPRSSGWLQSRYAKAESNGTAQNFWAVFVGLGCGGLGLFAQGLVHLFFGEGAQAVELGAHVGGVG